MQTASTHRNLLEHLLLALFKAISQFRVTEKGVELRKIEQHSELSPDSSAQVYDMASNSALSTKFVEISHRTGSSNSPGRIRMNLNSFGCPIGGYSNSVVLEPQLRQVTRLPMRVLSRRRHALSCQSILATGSIDCWVLGVIEKKEGSIRMKHAQS